MHRLDLTDLLLDAAAERRSAVIGGAMGVGKSHLLNEVAAQLRTDGWVVTLIRANPAAATIPFGALSSFVAGGEGVDRLTMLQSGVDSLADLAQGAPHLIAVDDAPMLDEQSVAVLVELTDAHAVPVFATARSSDTESAPLRALWRHTGADRHELTPLDDEAAIEMVRARLDELGATASADTADEIVRRAAGNPLFLIELVRAHAQGNTLTPHLSDLVASRIEGLDATPRRQLQLVAIADPLDVELACADAAGLHTLESVGLIRTVDDGDSTVAMPAHPLFGEVVRNELTALARRELSRDLISAMEHRDVGRRGDALRLAGWLRACGDRPEPELAASAALEAISWLDVDLARDLAGIAVADGANFRTLFAAGEVARLTGDTDEALALWGEAFEIADSDDDLRSVSMALAQVHGWFRNDPDEAVRVLELATERIVSSAQRLECQSERALFASLLGRYDDVLVTAAAVLEHPDADDDARWTALTNVTWAEAQLVDLSKSDEHFAAARALIPVVGDERVSEIDLLYGVIVSTHYLRGDFAEALAAGRETQGEGRPLGTTLFTVAQVHLALGDLDAAVEAGISSVRQLEAFDPFNAIALGLSIRAITSAISGDPAAAEALLSRATDGALDVNGVWESIWFKRVDSWIGAARGDYDHAVDALAAAVERALETGHRGWAALAMADVFGWYAPNRARSVEAVESFHARMLEWRDDVRNAPFVSVILDTIAALKERDLEGLEAAVSACTKFGATHFVSTITAAMATLIDDDHEACRRATGAMLAVPWPAVLTDDVRELALSERQSEVVRGAALGRSSRDIADDLFLSVRTVDNHLRASYRRLGVSGRGELAELFGAD